MNATSVVQQVLQEAKYRTWLVEVETATIVCFEDEVAMGFVSVFDEVAPLLSKWQALETALLTRYATFLRKAGEKAWNVYSAFLSVAPGDDRQQRQLRSIEENLERTRKIAAAGLVAREDVVAALLAILPIQYRPELDPQDLIERLRARIETIAPLAASAVLDKDVAAVDVIPLLISKP